MARRITSTQWEKITEEYLEETQRMYISVKDWVTQYNHKTGLDLKTQTMIYHLRRPKYINRYLNVELRT